ncbi:hypothetical protein CW751_05970 [Brumimicrobium salinarum]|uniref:Uncharacterized protein n=1 Tax=Brumimicrobium salinarum TaxID=2058658 RepID=A0A2I0R3H3_9FLAO|nr:hypothetical protein [Brumimicrobium salinarum]PKR81128.1 hypothetical protein CW751_05970 [Brumimicrobium salinarum]
MIPFKKHAKIALILFLAAASLGLLLRFFAVSSIEFEYRYVVHAHSHVALLGWVYFALITLIGYFFLKSHIPKKVYRNIFAFTTITVLGMMVTFPFTGYALFSIIFSTLFLIASYFYVWAFFKYIPKEKRSTPAYTTVKYALMYMAISSIGPWTIGAVMATLGPGSVWYRTSIYFYLHFQYNAWMVLGVLGIFLKILENHDLKINQSLFKRFLITFHIGVNLTFFLSILFTKPHISVYGLSIVGALIQLLSFKYFFQFVRSKYRKIGNIFGKIPWQLLRWMFLLLFIKMLMQFLGSFPYTAALVSNNTFLTIGFLHWVFLGVVTMGLLALLNTSSLIQLNAASIRFYIFGFILTEFIIFYKPAEIILNFPTLPYYHWLLFVASLLLFIGITAILISQRKRKNRSS